MDPRLTVSIIVAVADNGVIGNKDDLPRRLKSDLKRFKDLTTGHTVIVGRKTHESIVRRLRKNLPNRRTIVVSRNEHYQALGCKVVHSLQEALEEVKEEAEEVFILGGAELYTSALHRADKLYITRVHASVSGDTFFPGFRMSDWKLSSTERHEADDENQFPFSFEILDRRKEFVYLPNARSDEQAEVMKRVAWEGICPFCPEHMAKSQLTPVIKETYFWHLHENKWPYAFTQLHLFAIHNTHVERLAELSREGSADLIALLQWVEDHYKLEGGAIGMRFGDPALTGATVKHLHVHLIVADPNIQTPGYKRVRFPMGPKPTN